MLAALRDERYAAGSPPGPYIRDLARARYSPARLAVIAGQIEAEARRLLGALPEVCDLVTAFARPWSSEVAAAATGVMPDDASLAAAAQIFNAAVEPLDEDQQKRASEATAALAPKFAAESIALDLQAFVALTQTLPCALANSLCVLLESPDQIALLRADAGLVPNAVEELLRYAGPSRAIVRRDALSGQPVLLMLADANRDPDVFADPDSLDITRDASGHVAFGGGPHACVGAPLIRMALQIAVREFVQHGSDAVITIEPEWLAGPGIRAVTSLPVARNEMA